MGCSNWVPSDSVPYDNRIHVSQAACVIDYLVDGKPFIKSEWAGHHPRVGTDVVDNDNIVAEARGLLMHEYVIELPLEVQMWQRDHQIMDQARLKEEAKAKAEELAKARQEAKDAKLKIAALKKLTPSERALLGVHLSSEDRRLAEGLRAKKLSPKMAK